MGLCRSVPVLALKLADTFFVHCRQRSLDITGRLPRLPFLAENISWSQSSWSPIMLLSFSRSLAGCRAMDILDGTLCMIFRSALFPLLIFEYSEFEPGLPMKKTFRIRTVVEIIRAHTVAWTILTMETGLLTRLEASKLRCRLKPHGTHHFQLTFTNQHTDQALPMLPTQGAQPMLQNQQPVPADNIWNDGVREISY